jgi:hypothetical protein
MSAILHKVTSQIACSLNVIPKYPSNIKTEKQAAAFIKETMRTLTSMGWTFEAKFEALSDSEGNADIDMITNYSSKDDIFNILQINEDITDRICDYWIGNNGQEWLDTEIVDTVSEILDIHLKTNTKHFSYIREFFNQQLMFELVGYEDDAAYQNCKGETLTSDPICFLSEVKEFALSTADLFDDFKFIKVRSACGDFSELTSDISGINKINNKSLFS